MGKNNDIILPNSLIIPKNLEAEGSMLNKLI
jgi:hypothetical protein